MEEATYQRIYCDASDTPAIANPAVRRVLRLLLECADTFAETCRKHPDHPSDATRTGRLLCAIGLGADEAAGFLRALDEGLITLRPDGNFKAPTARACSPNLHLVGREGEGVKLHNEVLIHVTAYAELVLDHGWDPSRLVFDPFFANDALDLWGFDAPPAGGSWRDGSIVFAAEAKARVKGSDGLGALTHAFDTLGADPTAPVDKGHRRKWGELVRLTEDHPVRLLLVADGARWWYSAFRDGDTLKLRALENEA